MIHNVPGDYKETASPHGSLRYWGYYMYENKSTKDSTDCRLSYNLCKYQSQKGEQEGRGGGGGGGGRILV